MYDFEWIRLHTYDSIEYLQYIVHLDTFDNFKTYDLYLTIDGSFAGNYLSCHWLNQVPPRQFPLNTQLLHGHDTGMGSESFVTLQVIDTGKAYPPPQPGNYGPY